MQNLRRSKEDTSLFGSWHAPSCAWDALQIYPAPTLSTHDMGRGHQEHTWACLKQKQDLITAAMSTLALALGLGKATQHAWWGAQHQACAGEGLCRVVVDGEVMLVDTRLRER